MKCSQQTACIEKFVQGWKILAWSHMIVLNFSQSDLRKIMAGDKRESNPGCNIRDLPTFAFLQLLLCYHQYDHVHKMVRLSRAIALTWHAYPQQPSMSLMDCLLGSEEQEWRTRQATDNMHEKIVILIEKDKGCCTSWLLLFVHCL